MLAQAASPNAENLARHIIRRGMSNPDFEKLMVDIFTWLERSPEEAD
jgi:hypothetical protein